MRSKYILMILLLIAVAGLFLAIQFGPLSFVSGYFLNKPNKPVGGITLYEPQSGLKYFVYLPEGYEENSDKTYGVIYHLHGAMPLPWSIARGMLEAETRVLANKMEELVRTDAAEPAIIVTPYDGFGTSMWSDSSSGHVNVENQFIKDLMPKITEQYAVSGTRDRTYIQGFSMGGFGALKIGLKYPGLFSKITSWDGAVHSWETLTETRSSIAQNMFSSASDFDKHSPSRMAKDYADNPEAPTIDIMLFSGEMSAPSKYTARFVDYLNTLGVNHGLNITDCWHDPFCLMTLERVRRVYGNSK